MRKPCRLLCLLAVLTIPWLGACSDSAPQDTSEPAAAAEPAADAADAATGQCADQPYEVRPGAAKDAYSSPTNFLRCTEGSYALCYYSGADPLPCTVDDQGNGNCQCQVFEASSDNPMYVEIGGILNQCVYDETVQQCGVDGSGCENLCLDNPHLPGCPDETVIAATVAVACDYIAQGTFNPDAEFISTFSFAPVSVPGSDTDTFSISSNDRQGQYAGCMTAPCTGRDLDGAQHLYTTCACPLWPTDGSSADYQFGRSCIDGETNPQSPGYCQLGDGQVWSAAVSDFSVVPEATEGE